MSTTTTDHHTATTATNAAPLGCLSEHLNYFNENIASKNGDFEDIFNMDFDLVFDPILLMLQNEEATVARPVPLPVQQMQAPREAHHPAPTPMAVHSHSFVPHTHTQPQQASRSFVPSPFAAKPVIRKMPPKVIAPPQVSPTSVTAVFESIPAAAPPAAPAQMSTPSTSSPRKRSYSMVSASKPAPVTSSIAAPPAAAAAAVDTSNMSFQEQEDVRRERNRHHAKRSRQRKRSYMSQIEEAVNEMKKENERLFDILALDSRQAKAGLKAEEERKAERATGRFIAGLKQPRNRVLDNTTLAFLRELWK